MRLRKDFCLGGLMGLPRHSKGWRHSQFEQLIVLREHGYEGVVHWGAWADIRRAGLVPCGMARIRQPAEAIGLAHAHQDEGLDFTTLHAGTGFESDADMDRLASAIIDASSRTGYALHVETHRATMTQDIKRTIDLLSRFPELPDYSGFFTLVYRS